MKQQYLQFFTRIIFSFLLISFIFPSEVFSQKNKRITSEVANENDSQNADFNLSGTTPSSNNYYSGLQSMVAAPAVAFDQSDLPIVVINTNSQTIVDDPKRICNMGIISNGPGVRNHLSDPYNNYNGKIAIEIRGSSSQSFPKKSYGFETRNSTGLVDNDVSLLGMPAEHDWILSANYTDKSFCRNVLAYQLATEMGHYAARTVYVDLVVNGQYQGIYVLMESLKRDSNRVDIANLHPYEVTQPDITGGYILKVDKRTGSGGSGWTSQYPPINHSNNQTTFIQYDFPSEDSIVQSQKAYIQAYVDSFEDALAGPNFRDSIVGYKNYIAVGSWMDYFFTDELSKNVDGYRISSYLYKDKQKKLRAGPVWDFDIAWGNANYCSGNDTTGWAYLFPCTGDGYQIPFWWQRLLQDSNYTNEMKCRWNKLRQTTLSRTHIYSIIDSVASLLDESKTWNFSKWNILGTYVWPNPSPQPSTYAGEIQNLKNWVKRRLTWMDSNMPGNCNCTLTTTQINAACNLSCDGRAVALATSPYKKTYSWNNGGESDTLFNLCAGNYIVTFEDKIGCTKTDTVTITQPAAININTTTTNTNCTGTSCNGSAVANISGGTSPYTYSWSNGQTVQTAASLCQGNYSVNIRDSHGCTKSASVNILNPFAPAVTLATKTNVNCPGGNDGTASVNVTGGQGPYTYSWSPAGGTAAAASGLSAGNYIVHVTDFAGCVTLLNIAITQPSPFTFNQNIQHAVCNGASGSASIVVNGGSAPYTYSWLPAMGSSPVITSVNPGTYQLNVDDAHGCSSSVSVTINQPDPFVFTPVINPPTCFGGNNGSVTMNVTGGTGNIIYSWNTPVSSGNSANQLSSGQYSVNITDAANCSSSSSVTVTDPPEIILNSTSTTATCGVNDGTATTSTSNGTPPFSYAWFPSGSTDLFADSLNAGINTVVVTDSNGCVAHDTINVSSASGLAVAVAGQTQVSCTGDSDADPELIVTGGAGPYTYSWSPAGGTNNSATNLSPGIYAVTIQESNGCATTYQLNISEPLALSININVTNALCEGEASGTAEAIVTGGTGQLTYSWSSGQTDQSSVNLISGNYSVLVTDANGCTSTASTFVSEPLPIQVATTEIASTCGDANGSSAALASGGSGNYTYLWSNGVTDSLNSFLLPGNYSITVTDTNGCEGVASLFIDGTDSPSIDSISLTEITCSGGSDANAQLYISGGTGLLSYSWNSSSSANSSASNLSAGIHTIVVMDAIGCKDSTGFLISQPAPLAALIVTTNISCYGGGNGMIYADVGGGTPPYTYRWNNGQANDTAMNLYPGDYSVIISDANNCSASASGIIAWADSLYLEFNTKNSTCDSCSDGMASVVVTGGSTPYSYEWQLLNETEDTISNLHAGIYTLCVTDANNCTKCGQVRIYNEVISVEEISGSSSLYVFPNPMTESAVFAFNLRSSQNVLLQVFSATGQLLTTVADGKLDAGEQLLRFNSSELAGGIYFYRFVVDKYVQTGSLVKH